MTNSRASGALTAKSKAYTIATGVITITDTNQIIISGEGATDDTLDTINGGVDGQLLFCSSTSVNQDITFSQSGNIILVGTTFVTVNSADFIMLIFNGTNWYEISRSLNSS